MMSLINMDIRAQLLNTLRNERLDLEAIALVCELIAADCRWNIWFVDVAKKNASELQIVELLDSYDSFSDNCDKILREFETDEDISKYKNAIEGAISNLIHITVLPIVS